MLIPGAAPAIRRINDSGLRAIVVTNQRGIALGRMTTRDLERIHVRLGALLEADGGASIDAFFYCPHNSGTCTCRKPNTGMVLEAQRRWPDIDLARSVIVGDSRSDVGLGEALGMSTILLPSDAPDLAAAVDIIIGKADVHLQGMPSSRAPG